MCEAHRALYVRYIRTHHYLLLLLLNFKIYILLVYIIDIFTKIHAYFISF